MMLTFYYIVTIRRTEQKFIVMLSAEIILQHRLLMLEIKKYLLICFVKDYRILAFSTGHHLITNLHDIPCLFIV